MTKKGDLLKSLLSFLLCSPFKVKELGICLHDRWVWHIVNQHLVFDLVSGEASDQALHKLASLAEAKKTSLRVTDQDWVGA